MNRRELLKLSASFGAAALLSSSMSADIGNNAFNRFDHILLGCSDLDAGIKWVEERVGVRAEFGGNHPGRGTRNALLSLGSRHYLEIIAPDPAQHDVPDERGLKKLAHPRIVQWAANTNDIASEKRAADAVGVKTIGPQQGSRQRPNGTLLRWQTLGIVSANPLMPFFIQWEASSPHPSTDAPSGGFAKALRFESPEPDDFSKTMSQFRIETDIRKTKLPRIVLVVQVGDRQIELS